MNLNVSLTTDCEGCGKRIDVPYRMAMGQVIPSPSQVRVLLLEWSQETAELVEQSLSPDVSQLVLCDGCRVQFIGELVTAVQRLQEKRPQVVEEEKSKLVLM